MRSARDSPDLIGYFHRLPPSVTNNRAAYRRYISGKDLTTHESLARDDLPHSHDTFNLLCDHHIETANDFDNWTVRYSSQSPSYADLCAKVVVTLSGFPSLSYIPSEIRTTLRDKTNDLYVPSVAPKKA